jgi:hypothetical protein
MAVAAGFSLRKTSSLALSLSSLARIYWNRMCGAQAKAWGYAPSGIQNPKSKIQNGARK